MILRELYDFDECEETRIMVIGKRNNELITKILRVKLNARGIILCLPSEHGYGTPYESVDAYCHEGMNKTLLKSLVSNKSQTPIIISNCTPCRWSRSKVYQDLLDNSRFVLISLRWAEGINPDVVSKIDVVYITRGQSNLSRNILYRMFSSTICTKEEFDEHVDALEYFECLVITRDKIYYTPYMRQSQYDGVM